MLRMPMMRQNEYLDLLRRQDELNEKMDRDRRAARRRREADRAAVLKGN